LWEFEVVEVFLAAGGVIDALSYTEIELSPHGHYLILRFAGARRRSGSPLTLADYRVDRRSERWRGAAAVPLAYLPPPPWRANAFALHGVGAARRFLLAHPLPGAQPDFHQPHLFPPLTLA
jgi:hypothetical protein